MEEDGSIPLVRWPSVAAGHPQFESASSVPRIPASLVLDWRVIGSPYGDPGTHSNGPALDGKALRYIMPNCGNCTKRSQQKLNGD